MKKKKRPGKILSVVLSLGMLLGVLPTIPTVQAKDKYETLAFDKKLQTEQDFKQGKFEKVKMNKQDSGVELEMESRTEGFYITPEIKAPFKATHIGLHWRESSSNENLVNAYVRTKGEGEEFGEWIQASVELEDCPDGKRGEEVFASLVYAGEKEYAQAMIELGERGGKKAKLKELTFTFLNSGEAAKQTVKEIGLAPKAGAEDLGILKTSVGGQNVSVISREGWGADESLRFKDGAEDWPRSYHGTRKLVIHHTAVKGSNGVTDLEKNKEAVRSIYYYHAVTQGWGDIGYNALVDAAGNVYEGRYGTREGANRENPIADQVMVLDVEAGHTAGHNQGSFGVAAMGDFTRFKVPLAQLAGLEKVLAYVADERGVNVQGKSDFRRYDGTWRSDLNNLIGHRDATVTACPGDKLYEKIQEIKNNIDSLLLHNLSGFSGTLNGGDIEAMKVESGTLNFSWDAFFDDTSQQQASSYQYMLERVFGTPGVATDSQPWDAAWFFPGFATTETAVQIDTVGLQSNSNYVFYVRALDESGSLLSTAKHLNFETGEITITEPPQPDETAPEISVIFPTEGTAVSGTVPVEVQASDDVGVERVEFYINGSSLGSDNSSPYIFDWDTTAWNDGPAVISAMAYDTSGNQGNSQNINVFIDNLEPDIDSPTIPAGLIAEAFSESQINLSWIASSDNVGVVGYNIYRNGEKLASSNINSYQDNGLDSETFYSYAVSAFDLAGNESGLSDSAGATTLVSTNQAPVVTITSPAEGAQVSGVVAINATAKDYDGQVEKMQVYIDGQWMVTKDKNIMEYNFNTRKVDLGKHIIEVWAEDDQGKIGKASVTVERVK